MAFIPVIGVVLIIWKWNIGYRNAVYAVFRMLVQLLLIGYFLAYIFETELPVVVIGVLLVMVLASSWIGLRTMKIPRSRLFGKSFLAISLGGVAVLLLVTQGVLRLEPWYLPRYVIPLAGMIFANAMTGVSLGGERLESELERGVAYNEARRNAMQAALIPIMNSLFAVGLVSLPGMMTGQILSGVSPLIAARYQIMVMCMIFGAVGISTALFLTLVRTDLEKPN